MDLSVLTLNTWGVPLPIICKDREARMAALGEALASSNYDIVCLQELWDKNDFALIASKANFPHSKYFMSGFMGAGLAIFTRHKITKSDFKQFRMNGHPHQITNGDWYGAKGVAYLRINVKDHVIDVFNCHTIANYSQNDEYRVARRTQFYELGKYINEITKNGGDAMILTGDVNATPNSDELQLLCEITPIFDTCSDPKLVTFGVSGNPYSGKDQKERLDYVFYYSPSICDIKSFGITMENIEGTKMWYSDHVGYRTTLSFDFKTKRDPIKSKILKSAINNAEELFKDNMSPQHYKFAIFVLSIIIIALVVCEFIFHIFIIPAILLPILLILYFVVISYSDAHNTAAFYYELIDNYD